MTKVQKEKVVDLLHDASFYLLGIETVTGRPSPLVQRMSSMIDELIQEEQTENQPSND